MATLKETGDTLLFDGLGRILRQEGTEISPKGGNCRRVIEIVERRIQEGRVTDPSDYFWVGAAYDEVGNVSKAIEYIRTYTELVPNDPEGFLSLGSIETREAGNLEEGRKHLEKAIELDPEDPGYRHELGLNCLLRGDREGAMTNFQTVASSQDPEYSYIRENARDILSRQSANH